MKKTYILYCYIISMILMPFKWFAPEYMTELSEWGFKSIANPVGIGLLIIGVLLIQAKDIGAKERILAGIGLVAIVLGELYAYFTWYKGWYYPMVSFDGAKSSALPTFYIGVFLSALACVVFLVLCMREKRKN